MSSADRLLVISSISGLPEGDQIRLDRKFVAGMKRYAELWPGPISALLRRGTDAMPFSDSFDPAELPFEVKLFAPDQRLAEGNLGDAGTVLCSGDNADYLHLASLCQNLGKKLFYIIEYIPETRRQITWLDAGRSLPRKLYSLGWLARQELRRRRAFRQAAGLQANGYPAADAYRALNSNTLFYLDNRITETQMADDTAMAAKAAHLSGGGPLRLIHSGRLEPMKGSQDLLPVARGLQAAGVDFTLDIFGSGSLADMIAAEIVSAGLSPRVRLHGSVDFDSELVPFARDNADIYLSCHRQSDPSCSYLENMGCGLAVLGYDNRMLSGLLAQADIGDAVPVGDTAALAARIGALSGQRDRLIARCRTARDFARRYSFEAEFARRIAHLQGKPA